MTVNGVKRAYLDGAAAVAAAVSSPEVAARWGEPSVLEGQSIGMLAGHVARAGVWAVDEYLANPPGDGPITYESAGEYYGKMVVHMSASAHEVVHRRSTEAAAGGHVGVVADLAERLPRIESLLASTPDDRVVRVIDGGNMRLVDWLGTRIVEQAVHLDDLARSLGVEPWPYPESCQRLALEIGVQIGMIHLGGPAMIRTLYRAVPPLAVPVL